jgi:hypothetical protein
VPNKVRDLGALDHVLARQARDIGARPTDQTTFDDNCPAALPCKLPGDVLAWLAAAKDDVLDLFDFSYDVLAPASSPARRLLRTARPRREASLHLLGPCDIHHGTLTKGPMIGSIDIAALGLVLRQPVAARLSRSDPQRQLL